MCRSLGLLSIAAVAMGCSAVPWHREATSHREYLFHASSVGSSFRVQLSLDGIARVGGHWIELEIRRAWIITPPPTFEGEFSSLRLYVGLGRDSSTLVVSQSVPVVLDRLLEPPDTVATRDVWRRMLRAPLRFRVAVPPGVALARQPLAFVVEWPQIAVRHAMFAFAFATTDSLVFSSPP